MRNHTCVIAAGSKNLRRFHSLEHYQGDDQITVIAGGAVSTFVSATPRFVVTTERANSLSPVLGSRRRLASSGNKLTANNHRRRENRRFICRPSKWRESGTYNPIVVRLRSGISINFAK